MSCEQQRYYIFVSWKNGREPTQIHNELVNAEGEEALSLRTVERWVRMEMRVFLTMLVLDALVKQ